MNSARARTFDPTPRSRKKLTQLKNFIDRARETSVQREVQDVFQKFGEVGYDTYNGGDKRFGAGILDL